MDIILLLIIIFITRKACCQEFVFYAIISLPRHPSANYPLLVKVNKKEGKLFHKGALKWAKLRNFFHYMTTSLHCR